MAALTTEHTFSGTIAQVFEGIRQYHEYPNYLPGVTGIDVLPARVSGSVAQVRYTLKLLKTFEYTLDMFEEKPSRIWWKLDSSNIMKQSTGSWQLRDAGSNQTQAVYTLDVAFSGLVPQRVVDQITKANLPGLMTGMQKLIDAQRR